MEPNMVEHGRTKCTNVLRPNRTLNIEHGRTDHTNVTTKAE